MEESEKSIPDHIRTRHFEFSEIMQTAVEKAIEENRRLGIYTDEPQPSEKVAEDHERE